MARISNETKCEMIKLSAEGYSTKDIAKRLDVSISTVYRTITSNNTLNVRKSGNVVTKYTPDYKRSITPEKLTCNMNYGGVMFEINYITKTLQILKTPIDFDEDCFDLDNIEELKNVGEALVGIAMSLKELLNGNATNKKLFW